MKSVFLTICLLLSASCCFARQVEKCSDNPDKLYDRRNILEQLAWMLNDTIPEQGELYSKFRVREERAVLFFIHDLTDVSNKQMSSKECVNFINNHVYQVSPASYRYSFNYIMILEDGKLKIFAAINCPYQGSKLEEVIKYLDKKLANEKDKDEIIERVKNYRDYGKYFRLCGFEEIRCSAFVSNGN